MARLNLSWVASAIRRHTVYLLVPLLFSLAFEIQALTCTDDFQSANKSYQRIENEWPLRSSGDEVTQYIQKLGVRLAELKGYGMAFPWHFSVVRNLAPNAFSIGGGYVFVTEGAINIAKTESELVAILAHEIGHELAGHFCNAAPTGVFSGIFDNEKPQGQRFGVGSLIQVVDVIKEQQADSIALAIIQAGAYDPKAMLDLAKRLPLDGSTHIVDASRIRALETAIANLPRQAAHSSEEFLAVKRAMLSH